MFPASGHMKDVHSSIFLWNSGRVYDSANSVEVLRSLSSLMAYSVKRVSISISWETLEEIASGRNFVSSEMENRKTSLFRARGDAALLVTDMIGTPRSFRISTIRRTSLFLPVCDTIRAQSFSLSLPAYISCIW